MTVISTDDLHDTSDALVWAETFCAVVERNELTVDADLMLGWFANAMCAAEDAAARRRPALHWEVVREFGYFLHRVNDIAFRGSRHGQVYRVADRIAGRFYNAGTTR